MLEEALRKALRRAFLINKTVILFLFAILLALNLHFQARAEQEFVVQNSWASLSILSCDNRSILHLAENVSAYGGPIMSR
jgi:alpha-ketoglutarate-dependent taurine dioxygenase